MPYLVYSLLVLPVVCSSPLAPSLSSSCVASSVLSFVAAHPVVGFSGSRSLSGASLRVASWLGGACSPGFVVVGCARGADAVFRAAFPRARVVSADVSLGRGGFAARSVAVVDAVARRGGAWVSFPGAACPAGVAPSSQSSRCFCGSGSGSWASAAYALGRGVPVLLWLPVDLEPPAWGFVSLGRGWWVCPPPLVQPALF